MNRGKVGIQIGATTAPQEVGGVAQQAERLGYSEIWMAEDYFELGGISSVTAALASTEQIPIGLGVVAAAVRHPAVTAMEFATLGAMFPGRFMAGVGHGAPVWVRQMGLAPASPLGSLREAVAAIRQLLEGTEITSNGDYFKFDRVRLLHTLTDRLPLYLGVHGPASLRLSGELADGTLLGWFSSPGYVAWARRRIDEGRSRANRDDHHKLVVLCLLSAADEDSAAARQDMSRWVAPMLVGMAQSPQLTQSDEGKQLLEAIESDRDQVLSQGPPDSLLGRFVAAGDPAACAKTVEQLFEAGADRVVLVPNPAGRLSTPAMLEQMRLGARLLEA